VSSYGAEAPDTKPIYRPRRVLLLILQPVDVDWDSRDGRIIQGGEGDIVYVTRDPFMLLDIGNDLGSQCGS
jgi:hypothetical protein